MATLLINVMGCASFPDDPIEREVFLEANDPFEPMNRAIFAFNIEMDKIILEPTALIYRNLIPKSGRNAIGRFLINLQLPSTFVNNLLQFEFKEATSTLFSFVINTTIGLGGLFDPAGITTREEDLGQTIASWGIGEGFYLVLPFYGPSSLRDGLGLVGNMHIDPLRIVLKNSEIKSFNSEKIILEAINDREATIEDFSSLRNTSLDLYSAMRSLYRQKRDNDIRNGAPAPNPMFEFD